MPLSCRNMCTAALWIGPAIFLLGIVGNLMVPVLPGGKGHKGFRRGPANYSAAASAVAKASASSQAARKNKRQREGRAAKMDDDSSDEEDSLQDTTAKKAKSDLNMEDLIVLDMMQLQNLCMNGNLQVGVEFYRCGKYTPLLAGNREQSNSDRQAAAQVPSV